MSNQEKELERVRESKIAFTQRTNEANQKWLLGGDPEWRDAQIFIANSLTRHCKGDWGDLCDEDIATNNDALINGGRLMSAYKVPDELVDKFDEDKIWVITEWDRSVTTVLYPGEY